MNEYHGWGEGFEDALARTLIACYETKIKKNRGAHPADRIDDFDLQRMRKIGPYCPNPSRYVMAVDGDCEDGLTNGIVDMANDVMPLNDCIAFVDEGTKVFRQYPGSYAAIGMIRRASHLPKRWIRQSGGALFEFMQIIAAADHISGDRSYVTVDKNGVVHSCCQRYFLSSPGQKTAALKEPEEFGAQTSSNAGAGIQLLSDSRHCWAIQADEGLAKARLGCQKEEIKSLLYARSLPMTSTGRKRPILHLVEAHRRRIKNGTDIDISPFLRGVQSVEISGTEFTVRPPINIKPVVNMRSQERYFEGE